MLRQTTQLKSALVVAADLFLAFSLVAQGPTTPSKEYVRVGERIIAIEEPVIPTINIDVPASGASLLSGTVTVSGWAIDSTSAIGTGIASVQVAIDGVTVGTATYGLPRQDICNQYPGRPNCPNIGFTYQLNTAALSTGAHTITVSASSQDATPVVGTASVNVTVSSSNGVPYVKIESPPNNSYVSGTVTISGYALDNASGVGTTIGSVKVQIDNGPAQTATYGVADSSNPCGTYPGRPGCPNVGFTYQWNTTGLSAGNHTITVSSTDTDSSPDTGSTAITVTVPSINVPSQISVSANSGTSTISVTASSGLSWTASTPGGGWITITSGSGTGNGTINFTVTGNPNWTSRQQTITVTPQAGLAQTCTVTQAAASFSFSPPNASFAASGGSGSISITATSAVQWSASTAANFVTPLSWQGTGNGTINYSVSANTLNTQRTATIAVTPLGQAAQNFTITQAGVNVYSVSGRVATGSGVGIPGVSIVVNLAVMATTDSNGYYTIPSLAANGYFVIVPSISSGYIFLPGQWTIYGLTGNTTVNFTAIPVPLGVTVSPSAGSGQWQAFWFQTQSGTVPDQIEILYTSQPSAQIPAVNQCYLNYYPSSDSIVLSNDSGNGSVPPPVIVPSPANHGFNLVNNSQCLLNSYDLWAYIEYLSLYQYQVNLNLPVYFFPAYTGLKQLFTRLTVSGSTQQWQQPGSWSVPNPSTPAPVLSISTPQPGGTVSGSVTISGNVSDAASAINKVEIYVNGVFVANAQVNGTTYTYSWNSASQPGSDTIEVVAYNSDTPTDLISTASVTVTAH